MEAGQAQRDHSYIDKIEVEADVKADVWLGSKGQTKLNRW